MHRRFHPQCVWITCERCQKCCLKGKKVIIKKDATTEKPVKAISKMFVERDFSKLWRLFVNLIKPWWMNRFQTSFKFEKVTHKIINQTSLTRQTEGYRYMDLKHTCDILISASGYLNNSRDDKNRFRTVNHTYCSSLCGIRRLTFSGVISLACY